MTEDTKWGADLCFNIGGKMFCGSGLAQVPIGMTVKVKDETLKNRRPTWFPTSTPTLRGIAAYC
jgi:hypothetical protein